MTTLLEVDGLTVKYGQFTALHEVSVRVDEGQTLAVIGANGAGKSTLLRSLSGILRPSSGRIRFCDVDVTSLPAHERLALGLALVPEGRRLFASLSLEENLLTGTYRARPGPWGLERVYDVFPWMRDRRKQAAGLLSGGEQQAVAIGRALVSNPRVLMLDEASLGLAPVVVRRIYDVLPEVLAAGTSVLLVEQDVSQALRVADSIHCLLEGRSVLTGTPDAFTRDELEAAYFGLGELGRRAKAGESSAAPTSDRTLDG
jgi:branched-chain amino acid transport system ATP-binding protein